MAKAAKSKKAPKRKPAKPAAKAKKLKKAAKAAKTKAAPKRKVALKGKAPAKGKAAAKGKSAAKGKPTKRTVAVAKTKAAPKKKPAPKLKTVRSAAPKPAPKPAQKTARPAPAKPGSASPRFESAPGFTVAGLSGRYNPETARDIQSLWQQFSPHQFGRVPGQVGEKFYGVCYNFDAQGNFDYAASVEVDASGGVPTELTQVTVPAGRYAVFPHAGHVSDISKTWMDIFQNWLPRSGRRVARGPSFEVYSEDFDPKVGTGGVEIWIPLEE